MPAKKNAKQLQKEIGALELFKRRAKGRHEVFGQIADETDGVGNDDFKIPGKSQPSTGRVQGCKKPAF